MGILAIIALLVVAVITGLSLLQRDISFIADQSLGGRGDQIEALAESTFLPNFSEPFQYVREMVYFSVIENFGWISLPLFFMFLSTPLVLLLSNKSSRRSSIIKSFALGLFLYHIAAFVDGALLYIPVMAIYWIVVTIAISNPNLQLAEEY